MTQVIRRLLDQKPFLLMGILNVTPDSFYDGGKHFKTGSALRRAFEIKEEGADILDVGAESTRPGSSPLPLEEEWKRLRPVLAGLAKKGFDLPISVDTQKAEIAKRAVDSGATIINDISAGRSDEKMFEASKTGGTDMILMHMRGTPENMQDAPRYKDAVQEVKSELRSFAERALAHGIEKEKIVLDPGIGFGKRTEDNIALILGIKSLAELDFPVLLGVSRKSVIGQITGAGVEERLPGTISLNVCGLLRGAKIFRVHNVRENRQALSCAFEILKRE
jgi:dihydropteroate synthase